MGHLTASRLTFRALGPIELDVPSSTCVGLTGPSGSGKTLLLRALADLDTHGGDVWLDGISMQEVAAPLWRRQVAFVAAESQWWRDSVGEHFTAAPDSEMLAALDFDVDVLGWAVARLSAGERQRLSLARSLVNQPRALLLDEPTAHLDARMASRVEGLIERYRLQHDAATLWVSHDPEQLMRVSSGRLAMNGGRLRRAGD